MAEKRVQVAFHFKVDPSQPGAARIPETITRTVSVGEEMITQKVSSVVLTAADSEDIAELMAKAVAEATRTAKPKGATGDAAVADSEEDEMSVF